LRQCWFHHSRNTPLNIKYVPEPVVGRMAREIISGLRPTRQAGARSGERST